MLKIRKQALPSKLPMIYKRPVTQSGLIVFCAASAHDKFVFAHLSEVKLGHLLSTAYWYLGFFPFQCITQCFMPVPIYGECTRFSKLATYLSSENGEGAASFCAELGRGRNFSACKNGCVFRGFLVTIGSKPSIFPRITACGWFNTKMYTVTGLYRATTQRLSCQVVARWLVFQDQSVSDDQEKHRHALPSVGEGEVNKN